MRRPLSIQYHWIRDDPSLAGCRPLVDRTGLPVRAADGARPSGRQDADRSRGERGRAGRVPRHRRRGAGEGRRPDQGFYTDDFTHTHGSGKLDERDARVVSLLTGEPTVEMADDHELVILGYGGQTAIVRGKGLILNVKEQQLYQFRWVQTFVKTPAGWKLAASQATRMPDPPIPKK